MQKVRIGIIGIGSRGAGHAEYFAAGDIPHGELTAVCDTDPQRIQWARDNLGESVRTFDSSDDLIASGAVDAIIVATPHYDHPTYALKGFERGLHVLIEKPAGVYTKHVYEMNAAAEKSGKVFSLMFNQRTRAHHQKLRELVASGELGEIQRTNYIVTSWFRSQSYYDQGDWRATWSGEGGGVLMNQCPHNLDLWQWICGMPSRVRAFVHYGKYHDIEVDDDVTAYVEYANGATGVFITTTGEHPGSNRLEIAADRGKVVMEGGKITFWRSQVSVGQFSREYKGGFGSPDVQKIDILPGTDLGSHRGVINNWCDAILNDSPLLAPGVEGIHGVELANAMLLSSWIDDWVDIPIDRDLYFEKLQGKIQNSNKSTPE